MACPIATFELKNSLTKQTVEDAVEQYKRDRDPREKLFEFGRCVVHFAVDDSEVRLCTELKGKGSWFLPFNQGLERWRGQSAESERVEDRLSLEAKCSLREGLTNILENYAQIVEEKNAKTGKKKRDADFSALSSARRGAEALGATSRQHGAGKRYLIQHSAGSGKSNSIAWLGASTHRPDAKDEGGLRFDHRRD